jgi:NAD(P) transhydrogenase subunit alpha
MAAAASAMYARNISALLLYLVSGGELALDRDDELQAGVIVTSGGAIVHPALTAAASQPPQADTASSPRPADQPSDQSPDQPDEGATRAVPGSAR